MPTYGEQMRESEHHTGQINWYRNLWNSLTLPDSEERLRELVEDGIDFGYDFGELESHPKVRNLLDSR